MIQNTIKIQGYSKAQVCPSYLVPVPEVLTDNLTPHQRPEHFLRDRWSLRKFVALGIFFLSF